RILGDDLENKIRKFVKPLVIKESIDILDLKKIEQVLCNEDIYTLCLDSTFEYLNDRFNYIVENNIDGDIFLAGVWRGGLAAYLQALIIENNQHKRKLILADTFNGFLDKGRDNEKKFLDSFSNITPPSSDDVKLLFSELDLPLENVKFLEGDIAETTINYTDKIAILILDMDFYDPTYHGLVNLYENVDEHGIIYIDDYYCEDFDCKKATDEFISSREENKLVRINRFGISLLKNNVQMHDFSSLLSEKINSIEFNSF